MCVGILTLASGVAFGDSEEEQIGDGRYYVFQIKNTVRIIFVPRQVSVTCERFAVHTKNAADFRHAGSGEKDAEEKIKMPREQDGSLAKIQPSLIERRVISVATKFAYAAPMEIPSREVQHQGLYFCVTEAYPFLVHGQGVEM